MFAEDQTCLKLIGQIKWSNIYILSTNMWLSSQTDRLDRTLLDFIGSLWNSARPKQKINLKSP